jgi:NAD-dependent dihydropyrimidine dehydrogenase PreA subunit
MVQRRPERGIIAPMGKAAFDQAGAVYMTGTGNSFRLACWFAEAAASRGVRTPVVPMEPRARLPIAPGPASLLVLAFPTHAFTAPWRVVWCALRMPRGRGTAAAVVMSRAALKFGPVIVPGLDGTGCYLVALILALKGYRVRGCIGVDMPSNWMAAHSGLKRANVDAIIALARPKTLRFFGRILAGRRFYGSWVSFPVGLALFPVSVAYLLYGRFGLGKLFFASAKCDGCGLCARACQQGAIRMRGKRPYWTFRCESCMRCMAFCPKQAVEVSHSLAVVFMLLGYVPLPLWVLAKLAGAFPGPAGNPHAWGAVSFAVGYACYLAGIFAAYFVFDRLIRLRVINDMFRFTTLTVLFRRYHEPGSSLGEIMRGRR